MIGATKKIEFGSVLLCDAQWITDSGRLICKGVHNNIQAWAYPSSHNGIIVFSFHNYVGDLLVFNLYLRKKYSKKESFIVDYRFDDRTISTGATARIPIKYSVNQEGIYYIVIKSIVDNAEYSLPINITTQPWPKFNKSELIFLKESSKLPQQIRVNITCDRCEKTFTLEESVIPGNKQTMGTHPFPQSGWFTCDNCENKIPTKDIQGRIRFMLKLSLSKEME